MVRTENNTFTGRGSKRRNHRGILVPLAMRHLLDKVVEEGWMPHGSGIDMEWMVDGPNTHHNLRLLNSYHCMDEYGFYRKWQDFQIVFMRNKKQIVRSLKGPLEGQTQIVAYKGHWDWRLKWRNEVVRTAYAHGLRDYLNETLNCVIGPLSVYANGLCSMYDMLVEIGILQKKENKDES